MITAVFQSSPGLRAGRYFGCKSCRIGHHEFQSSPGLRAGRYHLLFGCEEILREVSILARLESRALQLDRLLAQGLGQVSILARLESRALHAALKPVAITREFQSSPGLRAGRYHFSKSSYIRKLGFNPRPA